MSAHKETLLISTHKEIQSKKHSSLIKFLSSAGAGVSVSYLTFPLEALKKYIAGGLTGQKFHPFRGSTIFAVNIVPTTTIQLMTDSYLNDFLAKDSSIFTKLIASTYCGIQGAVVATVVENCIMRQQVMQCGPLPALKDMFSQSFLRPWKSYHLIATRDGIFTLFMLQVNPYVKERIREKFPSNRLYAFMGSLAVGFTGALISHPFDTMATRMQLTHRKMPLISAAKDVITNLGGLKGFYAGFPYRVGLFFIFSNVIPYVKTWLENNLHRYC